MPPHSLTSNQMARRRVVLPVAYPRLRGVKESADVSVGNSFLLHRDPLSQKYPPEQRRAPGLQEQPLPSSHWGLPSSDHKRQEATAPLVLGLGPLLESLWNERTPLGNDRSEVAVDDDRNSSLCRLKGRDSTFSDAESSFSRD